MIIDSQLNNNWRGGNIHNKLGLDNEQVLAVEVYA